jgi:hypothetical protein
MAKVWGLDFTRKQLLQRVGDIRQLAGAEAFELSDGNQRGTRGVRLYNAAGLQVEVLTDRGMSITHLSWQGTPLAFISPVGGVHPAFSEHSGLGWLRTWPAGFLTTCGLTQVGSPVMDGQEDLGQHGRAASLSASRVQWGGEWNGEEYRVWVEGTLHEVAVFGHHISLRRRIWMKLDESMFWIEDLVTNEGFQPAPHMFLQHFNLGFPLITSGTRLDLPEGVCSPRDAAASGGVATCSQFDEPVAGYQEQVFYHDLQADPLGMVQVSLTNPGFDHNKGLRLTWSYLKTEYPVLVEWKMMGEGLYVVGVEPANCHVEGRVSERERGTLQVLAPEETRRYRIGISFESFPAPTKD